MVFPGESLINSHLAMGLFAFFVVTVSLFRVLADKEYPRLTAMKKLWGRRRGLLIHFLSNVALPFVLGIVFLTRGITEPGSERNFSSYELLRPPHEGQQVALSVVQEPSHESHFAYTGKGDLLKPDPPPFFSP